MGLSTYTNDQSGAYHFVGFANFATLFTDAIGRAVLEGAEEQSRVLHRAHGGAEPDRRRARGLLSLPGLKLKALYRTVIFLPTMLSVVIVGFAWNLILSPLWGVAEGR